ncbi:T9SS type A sorting domain-containing protein [Chitinophaga ginsengisoli]|uniref:T9SS type A sorting domain-containing protein n=1 Tax=Chitinophaga ginsengisoli TaxID=363837 RepID=UPI0011B27350|nr:T9SS type A sorting domain-containing protein [Chitinophaga ginsengisoli]
MTAKFQVANGTTADNSATGWYLDASKVLSTGYFAVKSNRLHAQELGGEGIWYSKVFSTAGFTDWQAAVKVSSEGDMNSSEYVKVYYKINGGSEILLDQRTGNFGTIDFTSPLLNGSTVQLVVKIYNYNNGGSQTSKYYIEEYRVFKEKGPCASAISVTATAGNGGVLTCANPSLTLSASSTASGVTYSWTGPGNFTSTSQNPVVSTAGTYTVTGTNSAGSASATVTVTENKTPPDLSATGGTLACGSSSVTLNATSSVSGVQYSWTGPGGYTSTTQNPTVSTTGTYTVTVRNPANGCVNSKSVEVTAGGATPTNTWVEDFSLSNGTSVDNGTTAWSVQTTSGSTFSVASNEFKISGIGTSGEGIWTSGSINISGKTNVSISINCRSAVSSGAEMNDSGTYMDYLRFYYKLNGGSEVLFAEKKAGINSHSTTNSTVSIAGLSGSNLKIVVRARASGSDEFYYFDNVKVTAVDPAVTLTTSVSGPVTCVSNATITVTPSGTVSSYAWTGPDGFTSTAQNPVVSKGGEYVVTATLPSGCTVSASATVSENKTAPDVTANGAALGCMTSVTLSASSSVANATYSWTGPNNFTSTSQNPSVSATGTYTVTVRDPANGCTASTSVQVSGGTSAPTAFWLEDFTMANGTTVDNGSTPWTLESTGGGTVSVQNNEFKVTNAAAEAKWSSGVIDISGKRDVIISADLRSEAVGSNVFEDDDYISVYYKLNGGAETLVYNDVAGIGTSTGGTARISIASAALNGSTLQVIIRARNSSTNEIYYFDNVKLTGADKGSSGGLTATASVTDSLTCTKTSVNLSGASNASGVTYAWSGPGNFTSSAQNPAVTVAGDYILTVSNGSGCSGKDTVTVIANTVVPTASAGVSGPLSCATSTVTLSASSETAGVTYGWTGPNGFTSTLQSPVVSVAGTYTLTVTNPANGCKNTATTTVTSLGSTNATLWLEDFTLSNGTTTDNGSTAWSTQTPSGSTFAVSNNEFKISGQGTSGESVWTSGVIDISGRIGVGISANARSAVTNGAVMNESGVYADYLRFYYKLNGGSEVLYAERKSDINGNATTYTYVSVAGLSGNSLQLVIRARATGTDEFYYVDNVKVTGTPTGTLTAIATVSDTLTCARTSVTISGNSNVSGVSYSWTGPGNFSSTAQNPAVTTAGDYILTVTNASTGCTAKDTVTVIANTAVPTASAGVSGPLSCGVTTVTLSASSETAGVTYSWAGPGGFTSTLQGPAVSVTGTYTVTVTNPVNGCKNTASVNVTSLGSTNATLWLEDFTLSNGTTVDNGSTAWSTQTPSGSTFAVASNEFKISGQGTSGESVWTSGVIDISGKTGVGISANARSAVTGGAVMNESGVYADYLRFYYKLNGGSEVLYAERKSDINGNATTYTYVSVAGLSGSSLQLVIRARATGTDEFYYVDNVKVTGTPTGTLTAIATVSDTLTCARPSVTLSGSSNTSDVTYSWSGPSGFTSTAQNPSVTAAGDYILTVTNASTGCTGKDTVTVIQNNFAPGATAQVSGPLTCVSPTVVLSGSSATAGVTYSWSGPGNFSSALQNPGVSIAGTYTVTVRNPVNGCTSTASVTVQQSIDKPNLTVTQPAALTCATTSVNLTATSSTANTTITWSGFAAGQSSVSVNAPGKYYVTATAANGCTTRDSVTVTQNIVKPNLTIATPAVLTCNTTSVNLTASSTTANTTFTWTGRTAGQNPISVTAPGKYYVTATTANGCSTIDSVTVTQDITKPNLTIATPAVLTCNTTSVTLTASSTTANTTFTWTGNAAGQNPISVSAPGKYYVTATTANGCIKQDSVTVTQDITKPNLTIATPAVLTCNTTSVNLTASSTTPNTTFTWTGRAAGQNPISVTAPGKYYVTVSTATGCSTTDSVTVTQDINKPNLTIATPAMLTCSTTSVSLTASSTTANTTFTWTGNAAGQNPISVSAPGKYYVTATSANGCIKQDSVAVTQDISKPNLTIATPAVLTCNTTSVNLTASSTTANTTFTWTGRAVGQNPISVTAAGKYYVTATASNGCIKTDSVAVTQDITKPNLTIATPAVLTCNTTSVSLTASSTTANTTFTWTGNAAGQNPISVSAPGKYYVTATSANGCIKQDSVAVTQDITKPNLTIATPAVLTCNTTSVSLTALSTTPNTTFTWTGRGAGQNPISVTAPGKYYVTVSTASGCSTMDSVTVTQDITKPNLTIATPAVLTCNATSVNLTASSTTANTTFTWTGNAAGQNPISVSTPGKYYVTATSANGCIKQDSVTVTQDIIKPNLTIATPAVLTCNTTSVSLTASSTTANTTFTWTGNAAGLNPISVSAPGKYYVTATSANGCIKTDSVTVTQDINKPNLTIATPAVLTCNTTSVNLTASSTTANTTFTWTGNAAGQNPISVSAPGKYYVTATSVNGCIKQDSVTVTQDITKPNLAIATPAVLTCNTTSVNLTASSTTANTTFTWTGKAAGQNPISVTAPGKYYITATASNGCIKTDSVTVTQDITKPNLTIATPAVLTCNTTSVSLTASSTTANTTFTWTGNAAGLNPISVGTPGKYYVTATSANGCIKADSVTVTQDINKPNLTIATPAVLTCNTTSINLTASSTTPNITFTWTGRSAGQNPISVTAPGKYYVTVSTATGCSTMDSVTVTQDITKPNLTIATPAVLTCNTTSVSLMASSTTANTTFTWTGNAAGQNPISVSTPGKYYVTVTAANGCIKQDSVTVTQDITKPNLTIATPAVLTCNTTSVSLTASSTTANTTFTWTGNAASQNPITVSTPGKYYVTATSANGCIKQDSVTVTQDITKPNLTIATPAVLTCNTTSVSLTASSTTANTTFTWTGNAAGQNPISVSAPGKYYVTATSANGCIKQDSVTVTQDITKPNLTIATPAVLTCNTTSVSLTASSTTANTTFTWTGNAAGQNPISVSTPGKYYVTATSANGCIKQDSVTVTQDITKPNLTIATPAVLTCNTTSVSLTASSTTANTTFTWTGNAAGQNPISVSTPGKYYVTATSANGCIKTDSVTVTQDINKPNLTIATPAVLTCNTTSINLTASSTTPNITFTWTGRSAGQNPISVTAPGKYYVTVSTATGCSTMDSVTVTQDITKPNLTIATPQVLTCSRTSVSLTASSTTANTTFTWTGNAAGQNPISVSAPGKYYVTATSANGCIKQDSVTVTQDITKPNLTIATPAVLTCNTTSVSLTASSTTAGTTFTWTGNAAGQNPISVSAPGKYYVTATSANGCIKQDSVTVTQDINKPNLAIATPQVLTCNTTSVNLTASSTTANTTFTWTGNAASQNPISVSAPGKYYVTATSANGCIKQDSVTVTQDITKPNLTIATPQVLTCSRTSVNLTASSTTANTTFTWTGNAAGQNPISVSTPGKYYVTVAAANGCTKQDSVTVTQDITKPNLAIATPAVLTCNTTNVNLTASSTTANTTFTWTGSAAGQNPISVSTPGKYYVTATSANGCIKQDSVTVTQDITKPNLAIATPQVLTCNTTSVNLTASSTTANTTFTWTGNAAGQNPISVSTPGKYYVTATTANGCIKQDSVTVTQDITKPNLTIATPAVLTCNTTSVSLTASSTTANTTFTWTGNAAGQNPISVSAPGKYYVTATTANGCIKQDSVTVTQDITKPNLTIATPQVLTCSRTSVNLTASSTTANTTFAWPGNAAGQNPISVSAPGKYYVTVTAANGCIKQDSVTVTQDITKPNLTIATPAVLTCNTTSVNLTASSTTANTNFTWTGNAAGQNPISVSAPGKYYVTATSANGCIKQDSVTVTQDITKPNLAIATPQVLTCNTTSVNLTASSTTANTTFTWTGNAAGQNPISVSAPGKYYVTATSANGCIKQDSVTVTQDINKPNLTINTPPVLTCDLTSINLTASSTTTNTTFTWTGFATGQNPVSVNTYGKYYVTATAANGCTKKDSVTVIQNITLPGDVQASNNGPLNCTRTSVKITGNTTTGNVSYAWTGPNSFSATTKEANINVKGTYSLRVTNNANGCYVTTSTTVDQNITPPSNVQVSNDGPLTCANDIVTLRGSSNTGGATYQWSGPGNFNEATATVFVTKAGTYTLSVTDPSNGCFVSTKTEVKEDKKAPNAIINAPASMPEPLSEDVITAQTVVNATYAWTLTSPDGSWQMIDGDKTATLIYQSGNAGVKGTFDLVVTDRGNGCQNTAQLVLTATPATSTMMLAAAPLEYKTYPNPFVDKAFITFKSPVSGKVTVEIYNAMKGHMEKLLFNQQVHSGETYKVTFDGGALPAGVHFCVIKANGRTYTSKLLLVR